MKNKVELSNEYKKPPTEYDEGYVETYVVDVMEPKSWALDSPPKFSRRNFQRFMPSNIPLIEDDSTYESHYIVCPPNTSEATVHTPEYDRRNNSLDATTEYQESYRREPFSIKRRVRPSDELTLESQQAPIVSTYQCDYQRYL
ncbi:hypothetical protein P879_00776 [Paragonimus westermani]|uniref:Uncharacterized protein n=1 Tax=Paragonimus westermani TaxID=34504 RepID=A0A8T0DFT8_9TREM|nr:hypothetical protein P879_00776 [Paragonimus westermani]